MQNMQCKICKSTTSKTTGICSNCGSLFYSPVQAVKDSVRSRLANILLGSLGVFILGIIIFSVLTGEVTNG